MAKSISKKGRSVHKVVYFLYSINDVVKYINYVDENEFGYGVIDSCSFSYNKIHQWNTYSINGYEVSEGDIICRIIEEE